MLCASATWLLPPKKQKEVMFSPVSVCMSVCTQDSLKSYEWILAKLAMSDHNQNISLFNFECILQSAFLRIMFICYDI